MKGTRCGNGVYISFALCAMALARNWFKFLFQPYSSEKKANKLNADSAALESAARDKVIENAAALMLIPAEMAPPPAFNDRQKHLLRLSWAELQQEIYHVGVVSFISLFENKLEFKHSFSRFKDLSGEELRSSPLVKAHAMSILHVIEQLVNRIDSTELWPEIIDKIGKNHRGSDAKPHLAIDVAAHCWRSMEPILIERGKYNAEIEEVWLLLIQWLGAAMAVGMKRHLCDEPDQQPDVLLN